MSLVSIRNVQFHVIFDLVAFLPEADAGPLVCVSSPGLELRDTETLTRETRGEPGPGRGLGRI